MLEIISMKIADIHPYDHNPRNNDAAVESVARSIQEFGFRNPIILDADHVIIAGHTRLRAAISLGMTEVPCVIATDLTPEQVKAFRIADNKTAEIAEWNYELLPLEIKDLQTSNFDLSLLGFDLTELEKMLLDEPVETDGETDPDAAPEVQEESVSVPGEIYRLGRHLLMCGDSTREDNVSKLMGGQKADMAFTDPPYGVSYTGGVQFHSDGTAERNNRQMISNDDVDIYSSVFPMLVKFVDGPCYVWFAGDCARGAYEGAQKHGKISAQIIWVKTGGGYGDLASHYKHKHEPCLYWKPKGCKLNFCGPTTETTIWELKKDGVNTFHPTQKPVELAKKAIRNHTCNVVLDLFGGSGSTLIACEQLNKNCRMMELDPRYCDVIRKRYAEFVHGEGCDWQQLTPAVEQISE